MPPNPENLKPFQKGGDPRIWKGGRPKSFSGLQELAQQIAHETAKAGGASVEGDTLPQTESDVRSIGAAPNSDFTVISDG